MGGSAIVWRKPRVRPRALLRRGSGIEAPGDGAEVGPATRPVGPKGPCMPTGERRMDAGIPARVRPAFAEGEMVRSIPRGFNRRIRRGPGGDRRRGWAT